METGASSGLTGFGAGLGFWGVFQWEFVTQCRSLVHGGAFRQGLKEELCDCQEEFNAGTQVELLQDRHQLAAFGALPVRHVDHRIAAFLVSLPDHPVATVQVKLFCPWAGTGQWSCDTYREVTLFMPALRSSSVHVLRTVATSMLPLVLSIPDVFRRWRANSASLRCCWCWCSEGCKEVEDYTRFLQQILLKFHFVLRSKK